MASQVIDGTVDWSGGFDTSRSPSFIGENQYVLGINTYIPNTGGGISSRKGFRCLQVKFKTNKERSIYENGSVQGEGKYFDGLTQHYLVSVDGYIFDFYFITQYILFGSIRNGNNRNNPKNFHSWISTVPFGAIVNDGESSALYITKSECRRTIQKNKEIGAGRMGIYVQNRFFYVMPDGRNIRASDILNPISFAEGYTTNIYGFISPEDQDEITAIGRQKTILRDAQGGNLAFSTSRNNYSIDVRGDRTRWGKVNGSGVGFVENTVPDIGAISAYSYEPFNGNIYFRNSNYGILSTKQSQYQFTNENSYSSHSLEASMFLENDTQALLSKCYSRSYKTSLYTTIAPELKGNSIIWNGLLVYSPDIYYTSESKAPRRFDGVYTGIRPWCVTVTETQDDGSKMLIHSHDHDGVNRIYLFDESIDYDVNHQQKNVEIQSKILTRGFAFKNDSVLKKTDRSFYSLGQIKRDLVIKIKSRSGEEGKFEKMWDFIHKVKSCCFGRKPDKSICFQPQPIHPQTRDLITVAKDPPSSNCEGSSPDNYFSRQDLFEITGAYNLRRWVRIATVQQSSASTYPEETKSSANIYNELMLFDYKI